MTPEELLEEWTEGEQSGMRPKRVQALRNDLQTHTGQVVPRRISEIEAFLEDKHWRGIVTRKLRSAVSEPEGTDE